MIDIKSVMEKMLKGCVVRSKSGVNMYTPDGAGSYAAFWVRDFYYMVENASELIPKEDIEDGIRYLLSGARADGWIPDRINADGVARYTAGGDGFPASPNLDNGPFMVLLADQYLRLVDEARERELFAEWRCGLMRGIDCLPTDADGFISNCAEPPHSPYGFTDTVCKTGALCFESLLLWQAARAIGYWLEVSGDSADAERYARLCASIEGGFEGRFLQSDGMLRAATGLCSQTDVWASAYAVSIGFPLSEATRRGIAEWLIENYGSVVESGQIRHLPSGEFWERTFIEVPEGTYQNGAFWATATGWVFDALNPYYMELAEKTLLDALAYFEEHGIFECVNGDYKKLDTYVASAAAVYGAWKKMDRGFKL